MTWSARAIVTDVKHEGEGLYKIEASCDLADRWERVVAPYDRTVAGNVEHVAGYTEEHPNLFSNTEGQVQKVSIHMYVQTDGTPPPVVVGGYLPASGHFG